MNPIYIGILTSVITEILKFIPFLNKNDITRSLVVLAVAFLGVLTFGEVNLQDYGSTLVATFIAYKLLIQPVAKGIDLKTQA